MIFLQFLSYIFDVLLIPFVHHLVLKDVILQVVTDPHRVREFLFVLHDQRDVVFEIINIFGMLWDYVL